MGQARLIRVLHFAQDCDTSGFFAQLARFHDRSRFKMFFGTLGVVTPELRRSVEEQGVQVLSLDSGSRLSYPRRLPAVVASLRHLRIDILHTHLFDASVVGLTAGVLAGVPLRVMTRHYSDYHTRIGKRWHIGLDRMCTRLAHSVIAVSHQTRRVMLAEEGAPAEKVVVIHNGIDLSRVKSPSYEEVAELRQELDLDNCAMLSVIARLHPEKGHEYMFRALPRLLLATGGKLRLVVAGAGPFRELYERQVAGLGVEGAVRFLGFRTDIARILSASDVVVLPSVAEAFGLVLAEAMAMEKAVVATRVGGIPEIIQDGVTGVLVPPASPEALADAILSLLRDPFRRAQLGRAGRRRVEEAFRFEGMMKGYEAMYETLLEKVRLGVVG